MHRLNLSDEELKKVLAEKLELWPSYHKLSLREKSMVIENSLIDIKKEIKKAKEEEKKIPIKKTSNKK